MPGKIKECLQCGKLMRSDNLKRHMKRCNNFPSKITSINEDVHFSPSKIDSEKHAGSSKIVKNFNKDKLNSENCNDILTLVRHLEIPNFKGLCNKLYGIPQDKECGIVYLKPDHLVSYYKDNDKRIYFDTLGQEIPTKIQKYLKSEEEFENEAPVIQRNTDIIDSNPENCKHLCLYVLDYLSKGETFQDIINTLKQ